MLTTGGCYCDELRFEVEVNPDKAFRGQCHCLPCQKISGGSPNVFLVAPESGFSYTKGAPTCFSRSDLENPVTREFCGRCGTPILTRNPQVTPGHVIIKAGAFDDPQVFGMPRAAIHTAEKQAYHHIPEGIRVFERLP